MYDQTNSEGNTLTRKNLDVPTITFLPKDCGLIGFDCVGEVLL